MDNNENPKYPQGFNEKQKVSFVLVDPDYDLVDNIREISNPSKNMERVVSLEKYDEETGRGFTIFRCYRNFQTWYEVEYFYKNSKKEMIKEFSQYEDAESFAENFLVRK